MHLIDSHVPAISNTAAHLGDDPDSRVSAGRITARPLAVQPIAASDAPWATDRSGFSTRPPRMHPPSARQAETHETPTRAEMRNTAFLKLNNASVNLHTGITQLQIASRSFSSQKYLDGLHATIGGLGKVINAGGGTLSGAADLAKLQGNAPLGLLLEHGANYLNSAGTPLKAFGAVLKDLDTALQVFADPTQTPKEKDLAFKRALSTIMRETGDTVTTLNETAGSASKFVAALGTTLATTGNIGSGMTMIRQNASDFTVALHEHDVGHAAVAGTGTLAGAAFLGSGLAQAIGKALQLAGYAELGERVYSRGEYIANYGEKFEAFQELLEPMQDDARKV